MFQRSTINTSQNHLCAIHKCFERRKFFAFAKQWEADENRSRGNRSISRPSFPRWKIEWYIVGRSLLIRIDRQNGFDKCADNHRIGAFLCHRTRGIESNVVRCTSEWIMLFHVVRFIYKLGIEILRFDFFKRYYYTCVIFLYEKTIELDRFNFFTIQMLHRDLPPRQPLSKASWNLTGRFTALSRALMTERKISWDRFEGLIYGTLSPRVSIINDDVEEETTVAVAAGDRSAIHVSLIHSASLNV